MLDGAIPIEEDSTYSCAHVFHFYALECLIEALAL